MMANDSGRDVQELRSDEDPLQAQRELGFLASEGNRTEASQGRIERTNPVEDRSSERHGSPEKVALRRNYVWQAAIAAADDPVELRREPSGTVSFRPDWDRNTARACYVRAILREQFL